MIALFEISCLSAQLSSDNQIFINKPFRKRLVPISDKVMGMTKLICIIFHIPFCIVDSSESPLIFHVFRIHSAVRAITLSPEIDDPFLLKSVEIVADDLLALIH